MGQKIDYSQNDGKTCSFCKKDLLKERNLIKSIAPGNIFKDIYHPRCFDKKDTIKPKNKKIRNKISQQYWKDIFMSKNNKIKEYKYKLRITETLQQIKDKEKKPEL